jgi:hypothetical protein
MTALPLDDVAEATDRAGALAEAGVTSLIQAIRYDSLAEFEDAAGKLAPIREAI